MNPVALILPLLVSGLAPYAMQLLKKASTWIAGLGAWQMRAVLLAVTIAMTYLGKWLGLPLPTDLGGFTDPVVNGLLTALLGHFAYKLFPSAAPAAPAPSADKAAK